MQTLWSIDLQFLSVGNIVAKFEESAVLVTGVF